MENVVNSQAYMWAAVVFAGLFLLSVLIAVLIPFKPNNTGRTARRVWFWVLCVLTPIVSFVVNQIVASGIEIPVKKEEYISTSVIASIIALVLFVVLGFAISKIFSTKKVGTWFN